MTKTLAYFLIIASVFLLGIDFYNSGFDFENGRIFRNISSVSLIIVALIAIKNKK